MNFCSHCGSPDILLVIPPGDDRPRHCCQNCGTIHYQNPKLIVGALVTDQDKILLCKRGIEPRYGLWNLPAGYMENGETVQECALRETWEESGAKTTLIRPLAIYNLPHVNQVYLFFLATLNSLHPLPTPESLERAFFPADEIPYEEMAFTSSDFAIEAYLSDPGGERGVAIGQWNG